MAKRISGYIELQGPAGKANPTPPLSALLKKAAGLSTGRKPGGGVRVTARFSVYALALGVAATATLGCHVVPRERMVGSRASFDLGCPEEQIEYVLIDKNTVGVRGCSKHATYVAVCDKPRDVFGNCTGGNEQWVMNTAGEATSSSPTAAKAAPPAP